MAVCYFFVDFLVEIGTVVGVYKIASSEKANWFHILFFFLSIFSFVTV